VSEISTREELIKGNKSLKDITDDVYKPIVAKPGKLWFLGLLLAASAGIVLSALIVCTWRACSHFRAEGQRFSSMKYDRKFPPTRLAGRSGPQ
jgi:hypothetical protein